MRFYLTGLARPKKVAQHLSAMFPKNNTCAKLAIVDNNYGDERLVVVWARVCDQIVRRKCYS